MILPGGEIHLWCARLSADPAEHDLLQQTLSADERERAARFRFEQHRNAFVTARGMLRRILSWYTGTPPEALAFVYGDRGKPALPDSGFHFNLSHSGDLALYALARESRLGVDIEHIHRVADAEGIAKRFFSAGEYSALMALDPAQREQAFFRCWTRKESYIKALGDGLAAPLDRFQVALAPGQPPSFIEIDGDPQAAREWSLFDLTPAEGYVAAIAAYGREWRLRQPAPELDQTALLVF